MATNAGRLSFRGWALVAAAALLALFAPFWARMAFFATPSLPALLKDLPESKSEEDQQLFQKRLKARYHVGSTEVDDLIDELRADGFTVNEDRDEATFDQPAGVWDKCRRSANIHWSRGEGDELAKINGGYYLHCPEH
ncbi:hypothetical protein V3H18_14010 [Methylocystis sp. 9N]|uniref:Uncharacterized protein n=1 Tax=Methylocystis borbori TaxID=3118750 RepID=A0ABU7XJV1_9HYPH